MNALITLSEKAARTIGLEKIGNLLQTVRMNGGILSSVKSIYLYDDLKRGEYVGTDVFGNKYYQNKEDYFIGRSRWVIYADYAGLNYDATAVPPEWYGWLHYKTDYLPHEDPYRPHYPWMLEPNETVTGTNQAYIGYSTAKPKVQIWEPKSRAR